MEVFPQSSKGSGYARPYMAASCRLHRLGSGVLLQMDALCNQGLSEEQVRGQSPLELLATARPRRGQTMARGPHAAR